MYSVQSIMNEASVSDIMLGIISRWIFRTGQLMKGTDVHKMYF